MNKEDQMNQSGKYAQVVEVIKNSLIVIKIAPFAFTIGYIICLIMYMWGSDSVLFLADTLFYTSPMTIILLLILSRIYKLCGWHRLQCCLPLLPLSVTIIDRYVVEVANVFAYINIFVCVVMFILSLINAYKIFFCDGK